VWFVAGACATGICIVEGKNEAQPCGPVGRSPRARSQDKAEPGRQHSGPGSESKIGTSVALPS
jgi:hypothetical protein